MVPTQGVAQSGRALRRGRRGRRFNSGLPDRYGRGTRQGSGRGWKPLRAERHGGQDLPLPPKLEKETSGTRHRLESGWCCEAWGSRPPFSAVSGRRTGQGSRPVSKAVRPERVEIMPSSCRFLESELVREPSLPAKQCALKACGSCPPLSAIAVEVLVATHRLAMSGYRVQFSTTAIMAPSSSGRTLASHVRNGGSSPPGVTKKRSVVESSCDSYFSSSIRLLSRGSSINTNQ